MRFAGLALRDIGRDAREAHRLPAVPGALERRLALARDPPRLSRIRATDPKLFCKHARSARIERRRHGAFNAGPVVRMAEVQGLGERRESSLGYTQDHADFGRPESLIRLHVVVEDADTSALRGEPVALLARAQRQIGRA